MTRVERNQAVFEMCDNLTLETAVSDNPHTISMALAGVIYHVQRLVDEMKGITK